jgi:hypothetical protein
LRGETWHCFSAGIAALNDFDALNDALNDDDALNDGDAFNDGDDDEQAGRQAGFAGVELEELVV